MRRRHAARADADPRPRRRQLRRGARVQRRGDEDRALLGRRQPAHRGGADRRRAGVARPRRLARHRRSPRRLPLRRRAARRRPLVGRAALVLPPAGPSAAAAASAASAATPATSTAAARSMRTSSIPPDYVDVAGAAPGAEFPGRARRPGAARPRATPACCRRATARSRINPDRSDARLDRFASRHRRTDDLAAAMREALALAANAIGLSDPNPRVGCVLLGRRRQRHRPRPHAGRPAARTPR